MCPPPRPRRRRRRGWPWGGACRPYIDSRVAPPFSRSFSLRRAPFVGRWRAAFKRIPLTVSRVPPPKKFSHVLTRTHPSSRLYSSRQRRGRRVLRGDFRLRSTTRISNRVYAAGRRMRFRTDGSSRFRRRDTPLQIRHASYSLCFQLPMIVINVLIYLYFFLLCRLIRLTR